MIGINRSEIKELNRLNLIDYLKTTDGSHYKTRQNGTLTHISYDNMVIYEDHSFDFATTIHAYNYNIVTLRQIYGYTFMEAVEKLLAYKKRTTPKEEIPHFGLFDN